jgi:predicted GH43/DUF377 family glycosyl hydrolase
MFPTVTGMGNRVLLILLILLLFLFPTAGVDAITLAVDTPIPEFILEDHVELYGNLTDTVHSMTEDEGDDFNRGRLFNVSLHGDSVRLEPTLDFQLQNNGQPVLEPGSGSDWDTMILDDYVVRHGGKYFMYYTGMRSSSLMDARHIGVATSNDGVTWSKYRGNPVIKSRVDSYDYTNVMQPNVIVVDDGFHMFYAGNHGNRVSSELQDIDICYATSDNGLDWKKHSGNPVIKNGPFDTDWNGIALRPGDVRWDGERYVLYVKGVGTTGGLGPKPKLGLYTSDDLVSWREYRGNHLYGGGASSWERERANFNTLDVYQGTYRMWTHSEETFAIGWIRSPDGLEWEDSGKAMLERAGGTIYSQGLSHPRSVADGEDHLMWVMCHSTQGRTVGHFRVVPEGLDGTYTSVAMDAGTVVRMLDLSWEDSVWNGSSISYSVRWSNNSEDWSAWTTVTEAEQPAGVIARYFMYRAEFRSDRHWLRPSLESFSINHSSTRGSVDYSVDGGPWHPGRTDGLGGWNATVPLHDGDYDVRLRAIDASAGEVITTVPVKVDLHPPEGKLTLSQGRNITGSGEMGWGLMASDTHGVPFMRLSTDPAMRDVPWEDLAPKGTFSYDGPDGNVTVYAELRDGAGRTSLINDSILVDTKPPTGNLTINAGAGMTSNRTVELVIEWADELGISGFYVSNHAGFSNSYWSEPAHEMEWELLDIQGMNTVYVKLVDLAGHETVIFSSIILDSIPPYASFVINRDAAFTNDRNVHLDIFEHEALPVRAIFVNGEGDVVGDWTEIHDGQRVPWSLADGVDGTRTVSMRVRDQVGNEEVVVDTIVLDSTPPEGTLVLPDCPGGFTRSHGVRVHINATDALSGIAMFRDKGGPDGVWYPFEPLVNRTLPAREGVHEIAFDIVDLAGNVATLRRSVTLDTTAPHGHVVVAGGEQYTRDLNITVELHFEDNMSGLSSFTNMMELEGDGEWWGYSEQDVFTIPSTLSLAETEGTWNVIYYVRDRAGNVGEANASIIVDTTGPVIDLQIRDADHLVAGTNEFLVTVWDEWDPSPVVEWRVDEGGWNFLEGDRFAVELDQGVHEIEVRAIDAAGNEAGQTMEEEAVLSLLVISTWVLLAVVIIIVAVLVLLWERKRTQEKMRDR